MGFRAVGAVYASALPSRLRPLAALVAHLVRDVPRGDQPAGQLFASIGMLARCLGVRSERHVRRLLRELEERGVLEAIARGGGRRRYGKHVRGIRSVYRFHVERLPRPDGNPGVQARVDEASYPGAYAPLAVGTRAYAPGYDPAYPGLQARALSGEVRTSTEEENLAGPLWRRGVAHSAPPVEDVFDLDDVLTIDPLAKKEPMA